MTITSLSTFQILFRLIVFLINIIGIYLIISVGKQKTDRRISYSFISMVILMFTWVNFASLSRNIPIDKGIIFIRIAWSITPLFFFVVFYFILEFLKEEKKKYNFIKSVFFLFSIVSIPLVFFTSLVIEDIYFVNTTLNIVYGPASWGFFFLVLLFTFTNIYVLFKRYFKIESITERKKVEYVLVGFLFFFIANGIFNLILPFFFKIFHLYYLGDYSTIILLSFFAYAIVKKELFGIKVVLSQILVVILALLILIQAIFTPSLEWKIINGAMFVFFIFFGIYLIKAIKKEEERTKKAEEVAKEEKRLREKSEELIKDFERLSDAKNQFIMATQHHLRTPLTSMRGYLDLIGGGSFGKVPKKLKAVLERFEASTVRLVRMVNEFLDISQFQLGKEVVFLRPKGKIEPILKEMKEELKFQADDKGIRLKIEKPKTPLPLIKADIEKLKAAFFNIADNAIKYTQKGRVEITTEVLDSKLRVYVKDTGIGLSKEEQETLFTKLFERGTEAKKAFSTGRGIGLYLSYQIVKAHNGKLWAESEGKGKGSTFIFELPIDKEG
ncbi:MAG: ATP-binding protein [Candidatus Paceibacterota bacterium]|nr:ATP-binding protein [Candidatus Paceibacterota bacterium]MDD4897331.1 ATP-binding protein [Candidatus Paceibacterota bacterium]